MALVGNAVLMPVALFYLLMDWSRFVGMVHELVPPRLRAGSTSFFVEADAVLGQYLRGQLLVMVLLAVYYSIGLALFGLDLALPIGVFTGLAIFLCPTSDLVWAWCWPPWRACCSLAVRLGWGMRCS